jgi:hypothetical protein
LGAGKAAASTPWGRAPGSNEPSGPRRRKQGCGPHRSRRQPTPLPGLPCGTRLARRASPPRRPAPVVRSAGGVGAHPPVPFGLSEIYLEGLYTARRKRTPEHNPRGQGGGGSPLPNNRSRRSRPRNLGRTGRRGRGAQEDAVW